MRITTLAIIEKTAAVYDELNRLISWGEIMIEGSATLRFMDYLQGVKHGLNEQFYTVLGE